MVQDDPPDDETTDQTGWLSTIVTLLEELESSNAVSHTSRSGTGIDCGIAIRTGLKRPDSQDERNTDESRRRHDHRVPPRRYRDSRRRRTRYRIPSTQPHITTRAYDDELLVTADVGDVDPEELTVGFRGDVLVVALEGGEGSERVRVPWQDTDAKATFQNGVLTVSITPSSHE